MQYRRMGSLGFDISALGFGMMRLPTTGKPGGPEIDEQEAIRMVRHAIGNGVTYIDTAYGYHGGNSEVVTGKALLDGYRDKVKLATKSPTWLIKKPEDYDRLLDEQLQKLQTDHIDFYLFHAIGGDSWRNVILKFDLIRRAEAAKAAGKIRHIGFSFHGAGDEFIEIIDGYDKWDFCQIQYNYMDIENQAGVKGLKHAASKGIAVVVMEPLLGGKLANPPKDVQTVFEESSVKRTPVEWALQWLWNQPEVSLLLSGMSSMPQTEENLTSAGRSGIGSFSASELALIDQVRQKFASRAAIPCTACSYCMPCPNGVDIPENFELYNNSVIYDDLAGARFAYNTFFPEPAHASACIQCGICEEKCPQKIPISDWMPKVHAALGQA